MRAHPDAEYFSARLPYGRMGLPVVRADEMARLDQATISERGIPGLELMERAGEGIARAIEARYDSSARIHILCGKGNNGGDGFVVARLLAATGRACVAWHCAPRGDYAGDAKTNLERVPAELLRDGTDIQAVARELQGLTRDDVIVDALLGTGTAGAPRGNVADLIRAANASRARRVAVDLPSGLDASTGATPGECIRADLTVTMALPKLGHLLPPGQDAVGELVVVPIGIPENLLQSAAGQPVYATSEWMSMLLPQRRASAHKGSAGRLLLIGGAPGYCGAVCLAASAGIRTGAGLVDVAVAANLAAAVDTAVLECITHALPDEQFLTRRSAHAILERAEAASAVTIGPGLGANPETRGLVVELVAGLDKPVVLDADGLNAFAGQREQLKKHTGPLVLTPHPGEMGRLLERGTKEVQSDRLGSALKLARDAEAVVVLKGANSVVATPDGGIFINSTGNPGMAGGGMGDVLTGMVGALLAQGLGAADAARLGVYLHGLAGDLDWRRHRAPVAASWLMNRIGAAIGALGGY